MAVSSAICWQARADDTNWSGSPLGTVDDGLMTKPALRWTSMHALVGPPSARRASFGPNGPPEIAPFRTEKSLPLLPGVGLTPLRSLKTSCGR